VLVRPAGTPGALVLEEATGDAAELASEVEAELVTKELKLS